MHQKHFPDYWLRQKSRSPKKMKNLYFLWQMVQQNYQEETTNSKNPLWDGNPPQGERISAENLTVIGKSFDLKNTKDDEGINEDFRGSRRSSEIISFIVIILNREVQLACWEKNYPLFQILFPRTKHTREELHDLGGGWRSPNIWGKKTNSIVFDIAGKGRNSVLYYNFAHELLPNEKISRKLFT